MSDMRLFDFFRKRKSNTYEYCTRCDANLTMQKGYRNDLPYWVCKGCGEMLINPTGDDSGIVWRCDGCGDFLNAQEGFADHGDSWVCTKCGFDNPMDDGQVYLSDDEFQADLRSPYRGLSDEDVLTLSTFHEVGAIDHRDDILLVEDENSRYVKKLLSIYDAGVYRWLQEHPVMYMPRICGVYESAKYLIVIEEYIEGQTVAQLIGAEGAGVGPEKPGEGSEKPGEGPEEPGEGSEETGDGSEKPGDERSIFSPTEAARVGGKLCDILLEFHRAGLVHRDIKPSNVMIGADGSVYLLDMNAAKWARPHETEDTRLLGTQYFAAPEQLGYGFAASSGKADVYAVGMLLNVMVTGKLPKECRATGPLWDLIEKCICLEADERICVDELKAGLERIRETERL